MRRGASCVLLAIGSLVFHGEAAPVRLSILCHGNHGLCIRYPEAWPKKTLRTETSGGIDKIVAVYQLHSTSAETGVPEGLTATSRAVGTSLKIDQVYASTLEELTDSAAKITYKRLADTWFVLSGYDAKGFVFYLKGAADKNNYKELNIYYPPENASYWKGLLGPMAQAFH